MGSGLDQNRFPYLEDHINIRFLQVPWFLEKQITTCIFLRSTLKVVCCTTYESLLSQGVHVPLYATLWPESVLYMGTFGPKYQLRCYSGPLALYRGRNDHANTRILRFGCKTQI